MPQEPTHYQNKIALVTLVIVVSLVFIGAILPTTNLQLFVWGTAAGLLVLLVLAAIKRMRHSGGQVRPEEERKRIEATSKWTKIVVPLGIGGGLAWNFLLPTHLQWLAGGIVVGLLAFPIFFVVQTLLQPTKPKPRGQRFPLEPENSSNEKRIVQLPDGSFKG